VAERHLSGEVIYPWHAEDEVRSGSRKGAPSTRAGWRRILAVGTGKANGSSPAIVGQLFSSERGYSPEKELVGGQERAVWSRGGRGGARKR